MRRNLNEINSLILAVFFLPHTKVGKYLHSWLVYWETHERGSFPSIIEVPIMMWVQSLIWALAKTFWKLGLIRFVSNLWNLADAFWYVRYTRIQVNNPFHYIRAFVILFLVLALSKDGLLWEPSHLLKFIMKCGIWGWKKRKSTCRGRIGLSLTLTYWQKPCLHQAWLPHS